MHLVQGGMNGPLPFSGRDSTQAMTWRERAAGLPASGLEVDVAGNSTGSHHLWGPHFVEDVCSVGCSVAYDNTGHCAPEPVRGSIALCA